MDLLTTCLLIRSFFFLHWSPDVIDVTFLLLCWPCCIPFNLLLIRFHYSQNIAIPSSYANITPFLFILFLLLLLTTNDIIHYIYTIPIFTIARSAKTKWTKYYRVGQIVENSSSSSWLGDLLIHGIHYITRHRHALDRSRGSVHTSHTTFLGTQQPLVTR